MSVKKDNSANYWPWLLIAIPFAAVLFGILMMVTATMFPDDVVIDSYYKDGMAINLTISMDELATTKAVTAEMLDSKVSDSVLQFRISNVSDSAVALKFYHVTDKSKDVSFTLIPEQDDIYSLSDAIPQLAVAGVWYVELLGLDESWRLRGRITTPVDSFSLQYKPDISVQGVE